MISSKLKPGLLFFLVFLLGIPSVLSGKKYSFEQSYLIDSTKRITLRDVFLKIPKLKTLKDDEVLTLGYIQYDKVIWMVTDLKEPAGIHTLFVVERPSMDSLLVFSYQGDSLLSSQLIGDLVPFHNRSYKANHLNAELPAGTTKVICRAVNAGGFNFPTHVLDAEDFFNRYDSSDVLFSLYFGFVFFVIIANIFLFLWLKERIYGYYVLATLASALLVGIEYGYVNRFVWPDFPVINAYIPAIYGFLIFIALFNEKFLALKERLPVIHKIYYVIYASYILIIVISLSGSYYHAMKIGAFIGGFVVPLLSLFSSIYILLRYKVWEVGFFIPAWTCYFALFMVYALSARGLVEHSFFTTNSLMIGSALELIFFFLAVVYKIQMLRRENERILSQQKEQLDELVSQRTEELNRKNEEILKQHELIEKQNEQLTDTKNLLELMVDDQTKNLILANEELVTTNERLEQLAYISAHNLRGPVATLKGLFGLYNRSDAQDSINSFVIEKSDITIEKLDSIIKDLAIVLDCSGQKNDPHEKLNLLEVLNRCKEELHSEIQDAKLEIMTDLTDISDVHSLPSYIHNIFYHLITNSARYSSEDRHAELFIHGEITENGFALLFKDNGIGIDMGLVGDRLFKPFKRFHYEKSGRGLGLFQVKAQVDALNGNISLKSTLGKGTEVSIYIPLKSKEEVEMRMHFN